MSDTEDQTLVCVCVVELLRSKNPAGPELPPYPAFLIDNVIHCTHYCISRAYAAIPFHNLKSAVFSAKAPYHRVDGLERPYPKELYHSFVVKYESKVEESSPRARGVYVASILEKCLGLATRSLSGREVFVSNDFSVGGGRLRTHHFVIEGLLQDRSERLTLWLKNGKTKCGMISVVKKGAVTKIVIVSNAEQATTSSLRGPVGNSVSPPPPLHLLRPESSVFLSSPFKREAARRELVRRVLEQYRGQMAPCHSETVWTLAFDALRDENLARATELVLPENMLTDMAGEGCVYEDRERAIVFLSTCLFFWESGPVAQALLNDWLAPIIRGFVEEEWNAKSDLPLLTYDPSSEPPYNDLIYVIHLAQADIPVLKYRAPDHRNELVVDKDFSIDFSSTPGDQYALSSPTFSREDVDAGFVYLKDLAESEYALYTSDMAQVQAMSVLAMSDRYLGTLLNPSLLRSHSWGCPHSSSPMYFVMGWLRHKLLLDPSREPVLRVAFSEFFQAVFDRVWHELFPDVRTPPRNPRPDIDLWKTDYLFQPPPEGHVLCAPRTADTLFIKCFKFVVMLIISSFIRYIVHELL